MLQPVVSCGIVLEIRVISSGVKGRSPALHFQVQISDFEDRSCN